MAAFTALSTAIIGVFAIVVGSGQLGQATDSSLRHIGNDFNPYTYEVLQESAQYILDHSDVRPKIGIICGSGLGALADMLEKKKVFPYKELPHFPESTVAGHEGRMVVGEMANVPVICMQGRFHFYEGYPMWKITMPIRVFKLMGIEILIVTNSGGSLTPEYKVGDVIIIKDHFFFPGWAGLHPLRGNHDERFGPRFFPLNNAYDRKLRAEAKQVVSELGMTEFFKEGVYGMVGGPTFETIAEARAFQSLGVQAIGMSTVPEVITAVQGGIRVFTLSLITDVSATEYDLEEKKDTSHDSVLDAAKSRSEDLKKFILTLVPRFYQKEILKKQ